MTEFSFYVKACVYGPEETESSPFSLDTWLCVIYTVIVSAIGSTLNLEAAAGQPDEVLLPFLPTFEKREINPICFIVSAQNLVI